MSAHNLSVALVTCAELPAADADTRALLAPLAARGVSASPVVWDDPSADWSAFDLAVVRSCWDYSSRRTDFLQWADRVPQLANPGDVLTWNTDKRYLTELDAAGIGVVPTTWVQPDEEWNPPRSASTREWVIKPAVSLCALDTGRYNLAHGASRELASQHVQRLQTAGRLVMVQPYVERVDTEGETSLVFIDGRYSHAMRKGAVLDGPDRGVDRRFVPSGGLDLHSCEPTAAQMEIADRALAAVPCGRERLLYARVDLVTGEDGAPLIMEIELTEPQLYFARVPTAAERFAQAIAERVWRLRGEMPAN